MKNTTFTVSPENSGIRLDKFIALMLGDGFSRTFVKYLMEKDLVAVNGEKVKHHYAVSEGDSINVSIPPEEGPQLMPEDIPLKIIYEDASIIVVNKESGMVVHPGAGNKTGTMVNALLHYYGKLPESEDMARPGIVHRLDKETSGVIVVARTGRAMRSLARQFQKHAVKKKYIAFVKGKVEMDNGVIEASLGRHYVDRKKMDIVAEGGKTARTVYHVRKRFAKFTVVELEPETGRTHQIRVHMKHIGHPILGDSVYGVKSAIGRVALHAASLRFIHPDTGEYVEFKAPLPDDMKTFIKIDKTD